MEYNDNSMSFNALLHTNKTKRIFIGIIWLIMVSIGYGLIFLIPLPPQWKKQGIFLTDEIILLTLLVLVFLTYRHRGWGARSLRFSLILILFTLPLLRLWESGESTWNIVLGLLPWADATGYYSDANRLIEGGMFSSFSGRRPLFASLLAVFLNLSNQNLQIILVVFTIVTAFAVFLFVEEVYNEMGPISAIVAVYISQFFYRPFVDTTLTEQFGYPMGLLACVVLIRVVRTSRLWLFSVGLILLTYALLIRAGTFLVLPLLILFAVLFYSEKPRQHLKIFVLTAAAIMIPFVSNAWLGRVVASPNAVEFANFADTLYGQAKGGVRWTQAAIDYPDLMTMQEPERSQFLYRLAWEEIRNHPMGLVKGSAKAVWDFLRPGLLSAFGFLTLGNKIIDFLFQLSAGLLFLYGLWKIWRNRQDAVCRFLLVYWAGTLLSIPFLPPIDAGVRPYAATIASVFLPLCFVFSEPLFRRATNMAVKPDPISIAVVYAAGLTLILLALIGAPLIRMTAQGLPVPTATCDPQLTSLSFKLHHGSYVLLSSTGKDLKTQVPIILLADVHRSFDDFAYADFASIFRRRKQPTSVTVANNLVTGETMWLIAPRELNFSEGQTISVCGKLVLPNYNLWEIESSVAQ